MSIANLFSKPPESKDLKLSQYQDIWTKFCFLDESGSLGNPTDPFFTIGFIKCSQPYYLQSKIAYERQIRGFYDEIKFNKLSKNNFEFAKFALDAFFATRSMYFCSYSLDKQGPYFDREFAGDPWKAYEDISIRVLEAAIPSLANELLIVIADYITAPDYVKFEVNIKRRINEKLNRLAIGGVCRFDSKSNDLLQLADLMVGAINYDLKLSSGVIIRGDKYKRRFVEHFRKNAGVDSFLSGFKSFLFNIFVDKDIRQRLPLVSTEQVEQNEKEPSS